ncbi:hypothetical protein I4U23_003898 [Adineta vaga]|nr:hypothetical protein I4U23_003898 [Adineta vaga]
MDSRNGKKVNRHRNEVAEQKLGFTLDQLELLNKEGRVKSLQSLLTELDVVEDFGMDTSRRDVAERFCIHLLGGMNGYDSIENELLDYDEDDDTPKTEFANKGVEISPKSSNFEFFHLKSELLRAIVDAGYEKPSKVQNQAIPQAILGKDILCQGKSGMGKTTVFILATIQQLQPIDGQVSVLVLCHMRELAFQISREYERFCKYMSSIKVSLFLGGCPIRNDEDILKKNCPHIVIGTPGRILALAKNKVLDLNYIKHFIIDECDHTLELSNICQDINAIFQMTPHDKQVLMFSTTLNEQMRPICKNFMRNPIEIYIDDETTLINHNVRHHYVKSKENKKHKNLVDLLDKLEFLQVIIFVASVQRCAALSEFLSSQNFPAFASHRDMPTHERLRVYTDFKEFKTRILVTTDLFERGIDCERVGIIFNYDVPENSDVYLHRAARTGRFGTKGLVITLISSQDNADILNDVQDRFNVHITKMPNNIDSSSYTENR